MQLHFLPRCCSSPKGTHFSTMFTHCLFFLLVVAAWWLIHFTLLSVSATSIAYWAMSLLHCLCTQQCFCGTRSLPQAYNYKPSLHYACWSALMSAMHFRRKFDMGLQEEHHSVLLEAHGGSLRCCSALTLVTSFKQNCIAAHEGLYSIVGFCWMLLCFVRGHSALKLPMSFKQQFNMECTEPVPTQGVMCPLSRASVVFYRWAAVLRGCYCMQYCNTLLNLCPHNVSTFYKPAVSCRPLYQEFQLSVELSSRISYHTAVPVLARPLFVTILRVLSALTVCSTTRPDEHVPWRNVHRHRVHSVGVE